MKVVSVKRFESGFCLSESELRRLIDNGKEQLQKNSALGEIFEDYTVTFKNGTIAEDLKFNDIIEQENHGHGKITSLEVILYKSETVLEKPEEALNYIIVRFVDSSEPLYSNHYSIFLKIIGESRDWVFLTTSVILDRIEKVKRNTFYLKHLQNKSIFWMIVLLTGFVFLGLKNGIQNLNQEKESIEINGSSSFAERSDSIFISKLDSLFENNKESNPIIFLTKIEKLKIEINKIIRREESAFIENQIKSENIDKGNSKFAKLPKKLQNIILFCISSILMFFVLKGLINYYPLYNFIWGDYSEVFNKKMNAFKYLIFTILGGIILSIIANKLTDLI